MSLVINTNAAATAASNNLAISNVALQRSLNRLSSGSKIVSPADDAGGLAVSMKLSAAVKRQGAAITNVANSTSYLQTQDGALKVTGRILDRISELKTLSSDPTKSSSDIANYNVEFEALQDELTSIGGETFNGVNLFGSATFNVVTSEDGVQNVAVGGIDLMAAGAGNVLLSSDFNGADGTLPAGFSDTSVAGGAFTAAIASNALRLEVADGASDHAQVRTALTFNTPFEITFDVSIDNVNSGLGISLDGGFGGTGNPLATIASGSSAPISVTLRFDGVDTVTISDSGGGSAQFTSSSPTSGQLSLTGFGSFGAVGATVDNFTIREWDPNASGNIYNVANASSLTSLGLTTVTGAIQDLATHRADNGAQQSRLGFASELLTANKTNLEAANSRIVDVDVATESTMLARQNILVQSGTAMLAQANQSNQGILRLLG